MMRKISLGRRKSVGFSLPEEDEQQPERRASPVGSQSLSDVLSSAASSRRSSLASFVFGSRRAQSPRLSALSISIPEHQHSDYCSLSDDYRSEGRASVLEGEQFRGFISPHTPPEEPAPSFAMGKPMRVVVAGARQVGKTAILRQIACLEDCTGMPYVPTIDDTYQVVLEEADRAREVVVFHDTAGIGKSGNPTLRTPYIQVADAFVLVYSVAEDESFNQMDLLKKWIERQFNGKDKKEVPIVVLGNAADLPSRRVDTEFALAWAARERVKFYEVSAKDRNSLLDFVQYLGQRHFHPPKESKFSLTRKLRSEKSNAPIVMDF